MILQSWFQGTTLGPVIKWLLILSIFIDVFELHLTQYVQNLKVMGCLRPNVTPSLILNLDFSINLYWWIRSFSVSLILNLEICRSLCYFLHYHMRYRHLHFIRLFIFLICFSYFGLRVGTWCCTDSVGFWRCFGICCWPHFYSLGYKGWNHLLHNLLQSLRSFESLIHNL